MRMLDAVGGEVAAHKAEKAKAEADVARAAGTKGGDKPGTIRLGWSRK